MTLLVSPLQLRDFIVNPYCLIPLVSVFIYYTSQQSYIQYGYTP